MEITRLSDREYKLKGKKAYATLIIGSKITITGSSKSEFVITEPGEYEVEGISVFAKQVGESLVSLVTIEDVKILATDAVLSESMIEEMDNVEVVIFGVDSKQIKAQTGMLETIEPTYVIPSATADLAALFVKEYEHGSKEADKLNISKATMNLDITEVVVLSK